MLTKYLLIFASATAVYSASSESSTESNLNAHASSARKFSDRADRRARSQALTSEFHASISELKAATAAQNERLKAENAALRAEIAALRAEVAAVKAKLAEK